MISPNENFIPIGFNVINLIKGEVTKGETNKIYLYTFFAQTTTLITTPICFGESLYLIQHLNSLFLQQNKGRS